MLGASHADNNLGHRFAPFESENPSLFPLSPLLSSGCFAYFHHWFGTTFTPSRCPPRSPRAALSRRALHGRVLGLVLVPEALTTGFLEPFAGLSGALSGRWMADGG
jgi:hypothetical protein